MIRQCFSRLSSISLLYTLFAVVFSLLIAVGAHPVVAADGDLDTSFGTGGKVVTSFLGQDDFVRSIAIQSDGKIVVAGETKNGTYDEFALARYNPDGTLDTSFGNSGGKMITNSNNNGDHARSVAIQSDGKIVLAGAGDNTGNDDFALYRYNTDGSLDSSFGTGGKVFTAVGSGNDFAYSVAIQTDGKIVVAGYSNQDFALVRYNTDGSLDTSFGTGGKVTTEVGSGTARAYSVAIQTDGKIVAAGYSTSGNQDFALVRYNTNGTLDSNFGTGGKVTTDIGSGDIAQSVAIQTDGKIVVAGYSDNGSNADFALVRYNTDGTLDTNFGTGGKVITAIGSSTDAAYSVAIQSDGKIVAAGFSDNGSNADFALVRYNTDGTLDTTFDSDGKVITAIGSGTDEARSVAIQSDGKIVAAGHSENGNYYDFALVRYAGTPPAPPTPVPTLPLFGLGILVSLLGLFGLRKLRQ